MQNAVGSIIVNIKAQVENFQGEVDKIKKALQQINPGSDVSKALQRQLSQAESMIKTLGKDVNKRISSETQLTSLFDKLANVNELFSDIGASLGQVNWRDLTGGAAEEIQKIQSEITRLKQEISSTSSGIWDNLLKSVPEVKEVFKELKIDPKKMGIDEFSERLGAAIEDADKRIASLREEQEKLNENISQARTKMSRASQLPLELQGNIRREDVSKAVGGRNNFINKTESAQQLLTENYAKQVAEFERIVKSNLGKKGIDDSRSPEIISNLNTRLDAKFQELREAKTAEVVESIVQDIDNILKTGTLTGAAGGKRLAGLTGNNVAGWTSNLTVQTGSPINQENLGITRDRFQNMANALNGAGIDTTSIQQAINNLLPIENVQELQNRFDTVVRLIAEGAQQINKEAAKAGRDIVSAQQEHGKIGTQINTLLQSNERYAETRSQIDPYVKELENTVKEQDAKIKELENKVQQITERADKTQLNPLQGPGAEIYTRSQNQLANLSQQAKAYQAELDKVKTKEQMLGQFEMFIKRWFSVYAVVRMVSNAFNSMKKNIQELDSVMTEIAIVTNMSQKDLWAQIPQYQAMAQQYAASIKGVYEVSQLYYQQGLEQADVMALTEQTLKMARISGLDYAQATDYMTNAVRSFKMEMTEAQTVVDVYSAIAAKSATNTTELASAMSKTASSAEAVGSSFENTTAMMAVMIGNTVPYN